MKKRKKSGENFKWKKLDFIVETATRNIQTYFQQCFVHALKKLNGTIHHAKEV